MIDRVEVSSIPFSRLTLETACDLIEGWSKNRQSCRYVCTANIDHLLLTKEDPDFCRIVKRADMVLADGMPVVWLSKILGDPLPERATGVDLTMMIGRMSERSGTKLFLLGGCPGSAEATAMGPLRRANVVGTHCPLPEGFDDENEQKKTIGLIQKAQPDILLVGFGAPKQEKWIVKNRTALSVPVSMGVGGTFEMLAGTVKRAPLPVQRIGMEWAWRFAQEPKRLFDRYFVRDMPFLTKEIASALRTRFKESINLGG